MNYIALLIYLPVLISGLHIDKMARREGDIEGPSSAQATKTHNKQSSPAARNLDMATVHANSLTKLSSRDTPRVQKGIELPDRIQQGGAIPAPSVSPAEMVSSKQRSTHSGRSEARPRGHISNSKAYDSFLIHKRDGNKPSAKNLLKTFIDGMRTDGSLKPANGTTPVGSKASSITRHPGFTTH